MKRLEISEQRHRLRMKLDRTPRLTGLGRRFGVQVPRASYVYKPCSEIDIMPPERRGFARPAFPRVTIERLERSPEDILDVRLAERPFEERPLKTDHVVWR